VRLAHGHCFGCRVSMARRSQVALLIVNGRIADVLAKTGLRGPRPRRGHWRWASSIRGRSPRIGQVTGNREQTSTGETLRGALFLETNAVYRCN
jgi:hypothetical protein